VCEIWTMGEILVEIMRPKPGMELYIPGQFLGPFPSAAPAIFVDTVARLGHSSGIIGAVGSDDFGRCVLERLIADGVCCDLVKRYSNMSTAVAFVTYFDDGSRKFIFHIDNTAAVKATSKGIEKITPPKFFHVMGCSLMASENLRSEILKAVKIMRKKGVQITFDPNIRTELLKKKAIAEIVDPVLKESSILFPGERELALLTGEDDVMQGIKKIFLLPKMKLVVLKKGKRGCAVFSRDKIFEIPAYPIHEIDPTGAGDCFDAGFLCGLLEQKGIMECGKIATAVGGLNAAAFGPMEGKISLDNLRIIINPLRTQ
jgi:sugar/nucleoside kinase (ribokinase family)